MTGPDGLGGAWELAHRAAEFGRYMSRRTDAEFRGMTPVFRQRLAAGQPPADLAAEAFAAVREAVGRAGGPWLTDPQLAAGAALTGGMVAEIADDEGNRLVSVLPAYFHALAGKGVHIAVLDHHLARRDSAQGAAVLGFLDLNVGLVLASSGLDQRRQAYASDVTYGEHAQFGYDYLVGNLAPDLAECVQREPYAAVVTEADSILIDQAAAPLAITARDEPDVGHYRRVADLAARLESSKSFRVCEATGAVTFSPEGAATTRAALEVSELDSAPGVILLGSLEEAIRARGWYRAGQDYVADDGKLVVSGQRGLRLAKSPRLHQGARQAVEMREGLQISRQAALLAKITVRDYFCLYQALAGLTSTAKPAATEFRQVYGLNVVHIQTAPPPTRIDHRDRYWLAGDGRLEFLVGEVARRHAVGQPVVVNSARPSECEQISGMLGDARIPYSVLKPGQDPAEAMAAAGRPDAVTVICGSVGRGHAIPLGGTTGPSGKWRQTQGSGRVESDKGSWPSAGPAATADRETVLKAGGLAVLSAGRNASSRADEWLQGLSGRHGEPGESQFFLAMDDPVMRGLRSWFSAALPLRERARGRPAGNVMRWLVRGQQRTSEAETARHRRQTREFSDVQKLQQQQIFAKRREFLHGRDAAAQIRTAIDQAVIACASSHLDPRELHSALSGLYPIGLSIADLARVPQRPEQGDAKGAIAERIKADAHGAYDRLERVRGPQPMRDHELRVTIAVLDTEWQTHLAVLDILHDQLVRHVPDMLENERKRKSALDRYRHDAYRSFELMLDRINQRITRELFKYPVGPTS
jgi:preprotein translocase subunit SecA